MNPSPTVVILIVSYNGREDLVACLASLLRDSDPQAGTHIVVWDNGSPPETLAGLSEEFPAVDFVGGSENWGFAGGNNRGWEVIQSRYPTAPYLCLLNQDTVVESGWLRALVGTLEHHTQAACAQSRLRLESDRTRINTTGNQSHYLGFGFTAHAGEVDRGQDGEVRPIDFASAAALLVRTDALRTLGLFDDSFFMYLEDADLGWKLRQVGYEVVSAPASVVYHRYSFKGDYRHYVHLERNRWWLLLVYYRWRTLLLLLPALLLMELGQFWFAWTRGRSRDKLLAWRQVLNRDYRRRLFAARRLQQSRRRLSDRTFTRGFLGHFASPELASPLIRWIANPLFALYWRFARLLLWW